MPVGKHDSWREEDAQAREIMEQPGDDELVQSVRGGLFKRKDFLDKEEAGLNGITVVTWKRSLILSDSTTSANLKMLTT
jgi:hypothetical protein